MQLIKCVTWSPQWLDQSISLLLGFLAPKFNFHILDVLMTSLPFVESFVL
jgi:hypothetical protein